jgi:hypothetical protein
MESITACNSAPSIGAIDRISRHVEFATTSTMSMHASFGIEDDPNPLTHEPIFDITRGATVVKQSASHMPDTIDDH